MVEVARRFDLLDGLRGIAAIAVVIHHYTEHNDLHWLAGAWVAVDLFFILSGFVIAHSYGTKILNGLSFSTFLLVRLIRLGPLYFLGLALGAIAALVEISVATAPEITDNKVLTAFLHGLIWIPYFGSGNWPFGMESIVNPIFPLNDPAWSLFFEMFVNVVFFYIVVRYRIVSNLKLVAVASACFVLCTAVFRTINPGWGAENFVFGFTRVTAEFFAGALVYSTGLHLKTFRAKIIFGTSLAAILCFALENSKLALVNSITLIPLMVIMLSTVQIAGWWRSACKLLGDLSYPLYILHFPLYRLLYEIRTIKLLSPMAQTFLLSAIAMVASFAMVSLDLRARRWLMAKLVNDKRSSAVV